MLTSQHLWIHETKPVQDNIKYSIQNHVNLMLHIFISIWMSKYTKCATLIYYHNLELRNISWLDKYFVAAILRLLSNIIYVSGMKNKTLLRTRAQKFVKILYHKKFRFVITTSLIRTEKISRFILSNYNVIIKQW